MRVIGLFDAFSDKNARKAAADQTAGLNRGFDVASSGLQRGADAVSGGFTSGLNYATPYLNNAGSLTAGGYTSGAGAASDALRGGLDSATSSFLSGLQPFQQNYDVANRGQQSYLDATGANGPEGNARATTNFQAGPGYQWQLDQGSQNVMRNKAATGQLGGGGTDVDLLKYGQGVANQGWGDYVSRLQPFLGASNAAASGIGNLYSGLGGTQANIAGQGANYGFQGGVGAGGAMGQSAREIGNLGYGTNVGSGAAQGQAARDTAGLGWQTQTGIGKANADADLAGNTASGNLMGFLGGLLGGGSNLLGQKSATPATASPGGGFGAGAGNFMKGLFGFADGGRPPLNEPIVVGERGPEVIQLDQPGTVVPNEALPQSEMRSYQPSWRDRAANYLIGDERPSQAKYNFITGLLGTAGAGDTGQGNIAQDMLPAALTGPAMRAIGVMGKVPSGISAIRATASKPSPGPSAPPKAGRQQIRDELLAGKQAYEAQLPPPSFRVGMDELKQAAQTKPGMDMLRTAANRVGSPWGARPTTTGAAQRPAPASSFVDGLDSVLWSQGPQLKANAAGQMAWPDRPIQGGSR